MSSLKKLPGVLAMQRNLIITDAALFNEFEGERTSTPINIIRHGIRGTQNVNSDKDTDVSNIQEIESARLDPDAIAMKAVLNVRFFDIATGLTLCAKGKSDDNTIVGDFKNSLTSFIGKAKSSQGINEVALRYARNIANGRWLWRNRTVAEAITVTVTIGGNGEDKLVFNALDVPLNSFVDYSENEYALAKHIANGLKGIHSSRLIVEALVDFGVKGSIEVFPSQNYVPKPKESKEGRLSRSLYKHNITRFSNENPIVGFAAIRDQKIGNALRTFDTWYRDYPERNVPIPIEPNGASLDAQEFFRRGMVTGKDSAFNLFLRLNELDLDSSEGMFTLACMIRGGVYGESDKESSKADGDSDKAKRGSKKTKNDDKDAAAVASEE